MQELVQQYLDGPKLVRDAIVGMSAEQLNATPIEGKWSTLQVVCHLADFEPIYADRMKRAIAEDVPTVLDGDENLFAKHLAYEHRDVENEIQLIEATRQQVGAIFAAVGPECLLRTCQHSKEGLITVEFLLNRMINHIPHHLAFVEAKKKALGI